MSNKLREAVESLINLLYDEGIDEETVLISHANPVTRESLHTDRTLAVLQKAKAALSEPLRNCDVGTAKEQEERYIKLKREHVDKLARCPAVGHSFFPDSLYWAQMPYEEVK